MVSIFCFFEKLSVCFLCVFWPKYIPYFSTCQPPPNKTCTLFWESSVKEKKDFSGIITEESHLEYGQSLLYSVTFFFLASATAHAFNSVTDVVELTAISGWAAKSCCQFDGVKVRAAEFARKSEWHEQLTLPFVQARKGREGIASRGDTRVYPCLYSGAEISFLTEGTYPSFGGLILGKNIWYTSKCDR